MTARLVPAFTGLLLLVAAVVSWTAHPAITAVLVGLAVIVMSVWQLHRRSHGGSSPHGVWTAIVVPLIFGALAVTALNGWIYRISADAGGESGEMRMLIGLVTGVIGMSAVYGYGRIRAQNAQVAAVGGDDDEDDDEEARRAWVIGR